MGHVNRIGSEFLRFILITDKTVIEYEQKGLKPAEISTLRSKTGDRIDLEACIKGVKI